MSRNVTIAERSQNSSSAGRRPQGDNRRKPHGMTGLAEQRQQEEAGKTGAALASATLADERRHHQTIDCATMLADLMSDEYD